MPKSTLRGSWLFLGNQEYRVDATSVGVDVSREALRQTVLASSAEVEFPGLMRYGISLECLGSDDGGVREQNLREGRAGFENLATPWAIVQPLDPSQTEPQNGDAAVWGEAIRTEFEFLGEAGALRRYRVALGSAADYGAQTLYTTEADRGRPYFGKVSSYASGVTTDTSFPLGNTLTSDAQQWFALFFTKQSGTGGFTLRLQKEADAFPGDWIDIGSAQTIGPGYDLGLFVLGPLTQADMVGYDNLRFRLEAGGTTSLPHAIAMQTIY